MRSNSKYIDHDEPIAPTEERPTPRRSQALRVLPAGFVPDFTRVPERDECRGGERPCPFVLCKWHLWRIDERDMVGRPRTDDAGVSPKEQRRRLRRRVPRRRYRVASEFSCGADIAETVEATGGILSTRKLGILLGISKEAARKIVLRGLAKLEVEHGELLAGDEDPADVAEHRTVIARRLGIR